MAQVVSPGRLCERSQCSGLYRKKNFARSMTSSSTRPSLPLSVRLTLVTSAALLALLALAAAAVYGWGPFPDPPTRGPQTSSLGGGLALALVILSLPALGLALFSTWNLRLSWFALVLGAYFSYVLIASSVASEGRALFRNTVQLPHLRESISVQGTAYLSIIWSHRQKRASLIVQDERTGVAYASSCDRADKRCQLFFENVMRLRRSTVDGVLKNVSLTVTVEGSGANSLTLRDERNVVLLERTVTQL